MTGRQVFRHNLRLGSGAEAQVIVLAAGSGSAAVGLVIGDVSAIVAPLVRVQSRCLYGEVLGSAECDCGAQLKQALAMMTRAGGGVLVYLDQDGRGCGLMAKAAAYELSDFERLDTVEAYDRLGLPLDPRRYDEAARLLRLLGLGRIRLLTNNPLKLTALAQCGIVVERVPLRVRPTPASASYLRVKQEKMGHDLGFVDLPSTCAQEGGREVAVSRDAGQQAILPILKYRAVLFDCDDTILATYQNRRTVLAETVRSFGRDLDESVLAAAWGKPFNELVAAIAPDLEADTFVRAYRARMKLHAPQPTRGADKLLQFLSSLRVRMFLVTSGSRDLVLQDLDELGLTGHFEGVFGYEDCAYYKPDPRVFEPALKALGVSQHGRSRILYVGDSVRDYLAANGAGLAFAAVTTGTERREAFLAAGMPADHIFAAPADMLGFLLTEQPPISAGPTDR
jgi:3,4-dihydroxy 2-butanone 4-phosphate synthase/GTP cyclohydrolase II